jgi:hypothetical protein
MPLWSLIPSFVGAVAVMVLLVTREAPPGGPPRFPLG